MGDGPASAPLKERDAAALVVIHARGKAGVDMRDPFGALPARRPVEIGVEHAAAAELQLEALAFADLQGGASEALDEIACGQSEQVAAHLLLGRRRLLRRTRALRNGGAAGGEQRCDRDQTTHSTVMAGAAARGKLAACARRR